MHNERTKFGMCSFAGCIFVAGGFYNNFALAKCEIYSTESRKWIKASSMNTKRCALAIIHFQDKIWAIGGTSTKASYDIIETYDLAQNNWSTIDTKLLSKRYGHRAVVHNKKFFVVGGYDKNETLSSVEVYSIETNQFSFVSPMSQARAFFGYTILNNSLTVFGGEINRNEIIGSVEVYDTEKQVWSTSNNYIPLTQFGFANNI